MDRRWRLGHEDFFSQIGPLRDLYEGLYRAWARPGVQLAGRTVRGFDLLPKHPDLCLQCCSRSHQVDERPENQPAKISHYAVASADSSLLANWIKFTIGTPFRSGRPLPFLRMDK